MKFLCLGENELPSWFGDEQLQQLLLEAEQLVSSHHVLCFTAHSVYLDIYKYVMALPL